VCLDIAHVPHMPLCRIGPGVRFTRGIEMSASRGEIRRTAITEFVDMKAVFAGTQTRDFRLHLHSIGYFSERDRAAHIVARGGMKHSDSLQWRRRFWFRRLRQHGDTSER